MNVFNGKNKLCRKQLTKLDGNKFFRSTPRVTMFVMSFAKSRALSRDPSCDRVMPRVEMRKYNCSEPPYILLVTNLSPRRKVTALASFKIEQEFF